MNIAVSSTKFIEKQNIFRYKRTANEKGCKMIERPYYIDRLWRQRGVGLVKVLTGMRRSGKSGILRLLEQRLLEEGVRPDSLLFINLELAQNAHLREPDALLAYIASSGGRQTTVYVLIDEAQEAPGIGSVIRSLLDEGCYDVFLTGSHTKLVEQELADTMSGRYVEVHVFPLSFREYCLAHAQADAPVSDRRLFQRYLRNGGLPHTLTLEDDEYALQDYLDGVYHTIVRKDVAGGLGHEDPLLLDAIARALFADLGTSSSASKISRTLSSSGRSCSDDTVARYLGALTDAYAFHCMRRFDLKTGVELKTQEKYYADDLGLRTLMVGPRETSLAGLLENVVYLELRRRYGSVYTGKHYKRSIGFVVGDAQGREYFQVVPSVLDPTVLAQTLAPLQAERDNYPKTILTLDEVGIESHGGIRQQNLMEWLLAS